MMKKTPAFLFIGTSTGAGTIFSINGGNMGDLFYVLMFFMVLDYITGLAAALIEGKLSSKEGFKGIFSKAAIMAIVAGAHVTGGILRMPFMVEAVIFFYLGNELLSILENAGRLHVPIPDVIVKAIELLKGKNGGTK
ncbi:holin family protein [Fictibacillus iocasae]|uniref:Holin family protein n=1 Tax=Fictibacillus iocasae TaxID=2715437 RepID=A0ABW2NRQ5_9BACL